MTKVLDEEEVKEVSIDKMSMKDFKAARAKASAEEAKIEEKVVEEEEKPKSKGGFQTRIDRLVKHNAMLEEELATERKKREELEAKSGGKAAEAVKVEEDPEPKQEDYKTHEEWLKAQTRWEVRQELKEREAKEAKEAELEERKAVFDAYNARVAEAQVRYDDWKEVVGQSVDLPAGVGPAIIEMENGPDVAYYLGKHPALCEELLAMGSLKAIGKVWRISEELEKKTDGEETEAKEEKAEMKEEKKFTPIKPVGSAGTKSSVALDKLSMREYKKARAAGRLN